MITPSELTLGAAKASSLRNISGNCPSSGPFVDQLNEACYRLMTYGNFWATVVKGRVCVYNNCVSWPRWVGTLLATNIGNATRPIQNRWYDFMPITITDCGLACRGGQRLGTVTVVDGGTSPVFQNVPCGTPLYIQVYVRVRADLGKTVTLYGTDEFGSESMTRNDDNGLWSQGEALTTASPFVQSTKKYREITRISKPITTGPVDVYMYNADTGELLEMAHYEPSETEPRYRHTSVKGLWGRACCNSSDTTKQRQITFLAKLKHIPAIADSDIIQIDNIPALKLMIQALRLEEAGADDEANKKQAMSLKELNRQLADKLPLSQIPVYVAPEGTALPANAGIGLLI